MAISHGLDVIDLFLALKDTQQKSGWGCLRSSGSRVRFVYSAMMRQEVQEAMCQEVQEVES
eukprot:11027964-Lingulodinium_polyedra.AAC.1